MKIQTILHHLSHAPDYYSTLFACPIKKATVLMGWSGLAISLSFLLNKISLYLAEIAPIWSALIKLLSGLIVIMNFAMIVMALVKRIRDWEKIEKDEGKLNK